MAIKWKSEEIAINSDVLLKGTMTVPEGEGPFPTILLLAGSGPLNRDGNAAKGKFQFNLYRELAEFCASLGFVTLRYDKRGVGESEGDIQRAGLWDAVNDAHAAIALLEGHSKVDSQQIIVLGHSEGCSVATALNERKRVHGLMLLAGAAEGLEEALQRQRDLLFADLRGSSGLKGILFRALKLSEKGEKKAQKLFEKMLHTDKEIIRTNLVLKMPAKYFREHFNYNVQKGLEHVECPVLAMTGTKDFQANPACLQRITSLVQGAQEVYLIHDMDHGLKRQTKPLSPSTYKKDYLRSIGEPIHEELLQHLKRWLETYFINK